MELCDVLYAFGEGRNHVALITDIFRDENGIAREVEVSEAIRTTCARRRFNWEDFCEKYSLFELCRYDLLEEVPDFDESERRILEAGVPARADIAVNFGNKSNYSLGEQVLITVNGCRSVEVYRDGSLVETLDIDTRLSRSFERGYYTLRLVDGKGHVEFAVVSPRLEHTVKNGVITVKAESCDPNSQVLYFEFREAGYMASSLSRIVELDGEADTSAVFTAEIPDDAENYKVYFKNKYGVWTHTMVRI